MFRHTFLKTVDKYLVISLLAFSFLYAPFIASVPYLDGNIDLVQTTDFYTGGFKKYFENWGSVHPPLKLIVSSLLFNVGGVNPYVYNLIGYLFGILGIIGLFYLSRNIFNKNIARQCALFLATSPLFLSVGVFSLTDYLLAVLIIVSLYFYSNKNYLLYALSASLAVMTKETGLLLPVCVIAIELIYGIKKLITNSMNIKNTIYSIVFFLPLIAFYTWSTFLESQGQKPWGDWIFAETAHKGAMYTIFNNLKTFQFLNQYAYQHWKQLFILNFNWIYWLTLITGLTIFLWNKKNLKNIYKNLLGGNTKTKTLLTIIIFSIAYFFSVLTFQTYTIPRYALPLIPFILMGTAFAIEVIITKFQIKRGAFIVFFVIVVFSSLFSSIDPFSAKLWGKSTILGEELFSLNQHLAGNDGFTYNMQYLFIVKKRTNLIWSAKKSVVSNQCNWIFPDPNNDYKTIKILHLNINTNFPCKNTQ